MRLRKLKGDRTEAEFSKRLGVAQATLNRILNQEQNVTIDTIEQLCHALRMDVTELLGAVEK